MSVQDTQAPGRASRLAVQVREVFEDVAGFDIQEEDDGANFIELGLDSLMLTQVALQLQKTFAVKITFRQLMGDCASLGRLVAALDAQLPAEPQPAAPAVLAAPAPAPVAAAAGYDWSDVDLSDVTVTIGQLVPRSGDFTFLGDAMRAGAELAAEQIAAAGGPTIEFQAEDIGPGDPEMSTAGARTLVADGVGVIQSSFGPATLAVVPIVEQSDTLLFQTAGATADQLEVSEQLWMGRPTATDPFPALADYNNGRLTGDWADAAVEDEELLAEAKRILATSETPGAEEWGIFDYDDFGDFKPEQFESLEVVARVARGGGRGTGRNARCGTARCRPHCFGRPRARAGGWRIVCRVRLSGLLATDRLSDHWPATRLRV